MRVHPDLWEDRLQRIVSLGLNTIQVYTPWNLHEPTEGNFDFSNGLNLTKFLKLAQDNGLNVLLRTGPYMCAEWENGGLPYWLLKYSGMETRTYNIDYINAIGKYFDKLFDIVKPLIYKNGGPILMIQVENEYGNILKHNLTCSHNYTEFLRDFIWNKLGNDTVLYTTDGFYDANLECGKVPGTLTTVDFGPTSNLSNIDYFFDQQKKFNNGGPLVCSEYWVNWFTQWGDKMTQGNPNKIVNDLSYMYRGE